MDIQVDGIPSQETGPLRNGSELLLVQTVQASLTAQVASLVLTSLALHQNATTISSSRHEAQVSNAPSWPTAAFTAPISLPLDCAPCGQVASLCCPPPKQGTCWCHPTPNPLVTNHEELVDKRVRVNTAWRTACGSRSCFFLSPDGMWGSLSSPVQDRDGFQPCVWSWFALSLF